MNGYLWYLPVSEEIDIFYSELEKQRKTSIDVYPKSGFNNDFKKIEPTGEPGKVSVEFRPFVTTGEFVLVYRTNNLFPKKCRRYTVNKYFIFLFDNKEVSDEYPPVLSI